MEIEILLKILLAFFLGGLIGFERELSQKEAGFRTNILIAVGSTLLTILSQRIAATSAISDPARIIAQIVTGIGFLGAGAIIQAKFYIQGLTTAATIWVVAAIGISIGSGHYFLAFFVSIVVFVTLFSLKNLTVYLYKNNRSFIHSIKVKDSIKHIYNIKEILSELNISVSNLSLKKEKNSFLIQLIISTTKTKNKMFLDQIIQLSGIVEIIDIDLH
jgi:putative Mg2+ transporter-C (MgtC) family protein